MSSSTAAPTSTTTTPTAPTPLSNDELSKRFFFVGLLGLPWLWIVHTLHWYGKQKEEPTTADAAPVPSNAQQEEITRNERSWVKRCQVSAIFVTVAWVAWVLVIQVFLTDQFPSSWFVRESGSSDATGW